MNIEWNPYGIDTAHASLQATRAIYAMREARGDLRPLHRVAVEPRDTAGRTRATFDVPDASRMCTAGNLGRIG